MATTYKVLGNLNPTAATETVLYTVPAATSTIVSTITICNQTGSTANYSIAIRPAGATLAANHYIAYNAIVPGNDTVALTLGLTLAATDVISVIPTTSTISFLAFGTEIT